MDSQHQQYPTDSVQQPVPKILPAAEFFSIVRKKLLAGRTVWEACRPGAAGRTAARLGACSRFSAREGIPFAYAPAPP